MRRFFSLLIFIQASIFGYGQIIIDHTCKDLQSIPVSWITQAKSDLHIVYEHTSHGSQLIDGMTGLYNWKGSVYAWNDGALSGALDIDDYGISGGAGEYLGEPDFSSWARSTRNYLNTSSNSDVNVVMWAWCGELISATETNINTYLSTMTALEAEFPDVKFIYMTGHVDGTGVTGNVNLRNEQIRTYCKTNNKILYDFADIESYDPDGNYYLNKMVTEACDYDSNNDGIVDRNWATEWQGSHTINVDWYYCTSAHSQPLNANLKAYAAWWLWARLAGWAGISSNVSVTGITVKGASGLTAISTNNGTLQLSASVLPSDATIKTVTWSVINGTGKATISSSGLLSAVSNGTVTARATATDGSGVYGSLVITISGQTIPVTSVTVTGAGSNSSISTDNGTLQLSASILPSDASNKTIIWSVANGTGKATISSSGLVTAVSDGTVTARATSADGSDVYGTLIITITNQSIPVTSVTVTGAGGIYTIPAINGTLQLTASVLPSDATAKTVTWSVINGTGQATVSSAGLVTAVSYGKVTVIATATDGTGIYGSLDINILSLQIPVTGITVTGASGISSIATDNGTLQLFASILPANATNKTVTWSIANDTGKATISSSGLVTAEEDGIVTAIATSADGTGISGILKISITNQVIPVEGITITSEDGSNILLQSKRTLQLSAIVSPEKATVKTVTWSVESITGEGFISSSGLLTAVSEGEIIVTATSDDGSGVNGTMNVIIKRFDSMLFTVTADKINIFFDEDLTSCKLSLYNMYGNLLSDKFVDGYASFFDRAGLKSGIYIVVLSKSDIQKVGKVILP